MAKKQTRRSVSISRDLYDTLRAFAQKTGRSMSQIAETGIRIEIATGISPKLGQEIASMLRAYENINAGKIARGEVQS